MYVVQMVYKIYVSKYIYWHIKYMFMDCTCLANVAIGCENVVGSDLPMYSSILIWMGMIFNR